MRRRKFEVTDAGDRDQPRKVSCRRSAFDVVPCQRHWHELFMLTPDEHLRDMQRKEV